MSLIPIMIFSFSDTQLPRSQTSNETPIDFAQTSNTCRANSQ